MSTVTFTPSNMWVVNKSDKVLEDGFDGVRYTFPIGVPVEIPAIVAHHIFGFGEDNKTPYLIRLGWISISNDTASAHERLAQFSFSSDRPKTSVHSSSPVVEAKVPVPPKGTGAVVRLAA